MKPAIISIKPEYINKIFAGKKTIEIRKKSVRMAPGTQLWLYATRPYARIAGVCKIKTIIRSHPDEIWTNYSGETGISYETFVKYVNGAKNITAITLDTIIAIDQSITLEKIRNQIQIFHPPQFFSYIEQDSPLWNLLQSIQV